jgi:phosphohistidine phosphatase
VRQQADAVRRILIVGHNPGLERLALALAAEAVEAELARMHAKFPTAALAAISFDARRWRDIDPGTGRLDRYLVPRDLAETA